MPRFRRLEQGEHANCGEKWPAFVSSPESDRWW